MHGKNYSSGKGFYNLSVKVPPCFVFPWMLLETEDWNNDSTQIQGCDMASLKTSDSLN